MDVPVGARALMGTVIVVGSADRLTAAAEALEQLGDVGVRVILISEGTNTSPPARVSENTIAIDGLAQRFLDNAVAAQRLSSLPALVWWRGGSVEALENLADLSDRLVLDVLDPRDVWSRARNFFDVTALTDLRWARLTRWRSALAHMFDLPQVRAGVSGIQRLSIAAADPHAARLFAGWLRARLKWTSAVAIEITPDEGAAPTASPLTRVSLTGPKLDLALEFNPGGTCLIAAVQRSETSARVVPLGDGGLGPLIGEELAIRTRDLAFEQALTSALELPQ